MGYKNQHKSLQKCGLIIDLTSDMVANPVLKNIESSDEERNIYVMTLNNGVITKWIVWELENPTGKTEEEFKIIIKEIENRVLQLKNKIK